MSPHEQWKSVIHCLRVCKHRLGLTANAHPVDGLTVSPIGLAYERPVPGGRVTGFLMVHNMLDQKYSTSGIIAANVLPSGGALDGLSFPPLGLPFTAA